MEFENKLENSWKTHEKCHGIFFLLLDKKMLEYLSKYDKIMKNSKHYFMKTIYSDNTCFLLGRYIFCLKKFSFIPVIEFL